MWNLSILGIDFYHLINWFILYSFFGWAWETCYVSVKNGKYVNRGFINGPLCTIYGCGALAVYLLILLGCAFFTVIIYSAKYHRIQNKRRAYLAELKKMELFYEQSREVSGE